MKTGCYLNFFKRYFNVYDHRWKFDVDTADVKLMILAPRYVANEKHKLVEQIKKHELKAEVVKVKDKKREIEAPNGYEEGGMSIGPVYSKQYKQKCLDRFDNWVDWTTTALIPQEKTIEWGGDNTLEKYPQKATFNAGTLVYYLNKGTDQSPLISWFECNMDCYTGTFRVEHSLEGFVKAHVNDFELETYATRGVSWSHGFTCRKKKRGEPETYDKTEEKDNGV